MKSTFTPDYQNILNAVNNIEAKRLPLYEHIISTEIMERIINTSFADLINGNDSDIKEFFKHYNKFFCDHGYDTVSYELCITEVLPGGGALGNPTQEPIIKTMDDFKKYPWDEIPDLFFKKFDKRFKIFEESLPPGMKAIGGVGNGIFESVQDLIGFEELCYTKVEDEELYRGMFEKVGKLSLEIWKRFLAKYENAYCVLRFGDDLGFKTSTMLSADDIREFILPQYKPIISEIHSYKKPFLFHCCGNIFNVMDDIIATGINAKHSNEDQIAPFYEWVERYGDKIGNFGGIDTDAVCRLSKVEMKEYIGDVIKQCSEHGGFAFGSGNSIPPYVPVEGFLNMVEIVREIRGE